MEDREHELPIATARPRRLLGRLSALRGDVSRWVRTRFRRTISGRGGVFLLTGIFFSGMMVCMGYVAERANKAADAIDEAQRAQRAHQALGEAVEAARWAHEPHDPDDEEDTHDEPVAPLPRDHVLFYITGGER